MVGEIGLDWRVLIRVLAAIPESNKPNRRLSDDCTYSLESGAGSGNSAR